MAYLSLEHLSFCYPDTETPALADVCLDIAAGEFVLLCGRSGSGKTTLLRHLKPALCPHGTGSGRVLLDGTEPRQMSERDKAARIGYLAQDPETQLVTDKVWHELAFGLESLGCDPDTMRLRVAEMASYFGIEAWFDRDVSTLSGGQKQLLNLAAVMVTQPEVLLLDEPTSQLDPIAAGEFLQTLRRLNRELGITVLMTEHRLEEVFPLADRVIVLEAGSVLADGTPRQVSARLQQLSHPLCSALPAPVRAFAAAGGVGEPPLTVREGRSWLTQKAAQKPVLHPALPEPALPETAPALELREVWFRYEKQAPDVLKGLSLTLPQGCILALTGGNGVGKSTALQCAAGISRPYRGKVLLFGRPLNSYKNGSLYRDGLALLPQDPCSLFARKTVRAELEEMQPESEAELTRVAALCGLEGLLQRHPADLSGGEQQRAALAKVLLTRPRVLLLDEPTKGLDSEAKAQLADLLAQLKTGGVSTLLVSHDVEFCAACADLVGMVFDGALVSVGTPRRFFAANSFYTTAASRMSRPLFRNAVTARDIADLCGRNEL